MALQDQTLTCKDCGAQFTWTADEQDFYNKKGFSAPQRCKDCRVKARANFNNGGGHSGGYNSGPRESFEITCSNCGAKDTVPFKPKGDRPVLCRDCFRKSKNG